MTERPLRILQVSAHFLPGHRGTELTVACLSRALHEMGHSVRILTVSAERVTREEVWEGLPLHRAARNLSYRRAVLSVNLGRELLRAKDCDIYHVHIPFHSGLEMATLASLVNRIPLVTNHHGEGPAVGMVHGAVRGAYNAFYRRLMLSRVARLVFFTASYPRSIGLNPSTMERVKIVPPAVDSRRFRPVDDVEGLRSRLNIGPDDKTVLFVSDLSYRDRRRHGDYLIDATALLVRHIPGIHLAIVGEGDLLPSLRERARGLGLASKVSFAGRVTGDDLAQYYAACDVFAFPSTYESFGYVVLEAMASGKPCVVCDIPGVRDLVEPGVTGLRVPPDDVPALAEALGMLLENNRMRMSMGREARGRAASRTWEQVAEDMVGVYRETLRGRPGVQPSGRTRPA